MVGAQRQVTQFQGPGEVGCPGLKAQLAARVEPALARLVDSFAHQCGQTQVIIPRVESILATTRVPLVQIIHRAGMLLQLLVQ